MRHPSKLCHRAREWTSLRLDGELSEFEGVLLDAHLTRCAECREFGRTAEAVTAHVRATPLEPLTRPLTLPGRRRTVLTPLRLGTAAAAAAAVIGLTSVVSSVHSEAPITPYSLTPAAESAFDVDRELRAIRRDALKPPPVHSRGAHSFGAI